MPIQRKLIAETHRVQRIISGGQTGVDRAALDVAIELGIDHGGWCPQGRRAEDGTIPSKYNLQELDSPHYQHRTRQNVLDSDGTLILFRGTLTGGSLLTVKFAASHSKPFWKQTIGRTVLPDECHAWLERENIKVLNVAGPRASTDPEIYAKATKFLKTLLS